MIQIIPTGFYRLQRDTVVWTDEDMEVLFHIKLWFWKKHYIFCTTELRKPKIYTVKNRTGEKKWVLTTLLKTSVNLLLLRADGEGVVDLVFWRGGNEKKMHQGFYWKDIFHEKTAAACSFNEILYLCHHIMFLNCQW